MIRLFGSGGLFGYFGLMVLIKADKNYLLAPENPEDFVKNLRLLDAVDITLASENLLLG